MKVVLVNDTSLWNNHFGCQLVGQTIREQLARCGHELIHSAPLFFKEHDEKYFAKADLVLINGEGSIHHDKNLSLVDIAKDYPAALINAVWQDNSMCENLKHMKYISVRESYSHREITKQGVEADIVPDLIFASSLLNSYHRPVGVKGLGVTDSVLNTKMGFSPKVSMPAEYLKQLAKFNRVCTGRFHAAIACAVMGIPFSTWDSNTHKIQAMMEDMGLPEFHKSSFDEAKEVCPKKVQPQTKEYHLDAKKKINSLFDGLSKL